MELQSTAILLPALAYKLLGTAPALVEGTMMFPGEENKDVRPH